VGPFVEAQLHANGLGQRGMGTPQREVDHAGSKPKVEHRSILKAHHQELQSGVAAKQFGSCRPITVRCGALRDINKS
jgi:hypothetical protein